MNNNNCTGRQKLLRAYAGLPRRGISIRATHHIFNSQVDMEENVDGVWATPYSSYPPNCCTARAQPDRRTKSAVVSLSSHSNIASTIDYRPQSWIVSINKKSASFVRWSFVTTCVWSDDSFRNVSEPYLDRRARCTNSQKLFKVSGTKGRRPLSDKRALLRPAQQKRVKWRKV
jgi:hypothetical protein